ncbi:MAG: BamA/TamA family outer membrane protein, partial [Pseudomonadota bacterium]
MKRILASLTAIWLACSGHLAISQTSAEPSEGRRFAQIEVTGNSRFRDGDILATADLRPGIAYTENDIVSAVEALEFTGEFESVRIFSRGDTLTIAVVEEPTYQGALSLGIGATSDIGIFGAIGLRLSDAFGGETDITADLSFAEEEKHARLDIYNPEIWPGGHPGGLRLNYGQFDYDSTLFDFNEVSIAPYLTFGKAPGRTGEFRLTGYWSSLDDVATDASAIVQAEEGSRALFGPGVSLRWQDQTDGPGNWALSFDLDAFFGDENLFRAQLSFASEQPFFGQTTLRTRASFGALTGETTAVDRFTLGGSSLRGFERGGVTPRDICNGCAADGSDVVTDLGGQYFAVIQNDLLLPIFREGSPLVPSIFLDVGSVWDLDSDTDPSGRLDDDFALRSSAGVAISADTPLGDFSSFEPAQTATAPG